MIFERFYCGTPLISKSCKKAMPESDPGRRFQRISVLVASVRSMPNPLAPSTLRQEIPRGGMSVENR